MTVFHTEFFETPYSDHVLMESIFKFQPKVVKCPTAVVPHKRNALVNCLEAANGSTNFPLPAKPQQASVPNQTQNPIT